MCERNIIFFSFSYLFYLMWQVRQPDALSAGLSAGRHVVSRSPDEQDIKHLETGNKLVLTRISHYDDRFRGAHTPPPK